MILIKSEPLDTRPPEGSVIPELSCHNTMGSCQQPFHSIILLSTAEQLKCMVFLFTDTGLGCVTYHDKSDRPAATSLTSGMLFYPL